MTRFMSQDHSSKKSIDDKRDLEKLLLTNLVIYFHFFFCFQNYSTLTRGTGSSMVNCFRISL